jgi:prepilin-type N-terminal cleavage/methylation domain-containing protein
MRNRSSNIKTDRSGFTLIEIMLALLVITIGIVASIGLLSSGLDSSAKSHDDMNIVSFADMVFNYCQVADFDTIPPSGTIQMPGYDQDTVNLAIGSVAQFTCSITGFSGNPKEAYIVTYRLDVIPDGQVKALSLKIWPGYDINDNPRRFYTEIYNWRKN